MNLPVYVGAGQNDKQQSKNNLLPVHLLIYFAL
jgi:hypothetical protein